MNQPIVKRPSEKLRTRILDDVKRETEELRNLEKTVQDRNKLEVVVREAETLQKLYAIGNK